MVLAFNLPLIYLILFMNIGRVDLGFAAYLYVSCVIIGYYMLPLLLIITALSLLFFALRRTLIWLSGLAVVLYIYYLLIDHFVYTIAKMHVDLFWLEWIIDDFHSFGLTASTIRYILIALVVIAGAEFLVFIFARKIKKPRFLVPAFIGAILAAFCISQVMHMFAYYRNYQKITNLSQDFPIYFPIISQKHAVKYADLFPVFQNKGISPLNEPGSSLNYPLSAMRYDRPPDAALPNIVVLLLESWRIDMMNERVTPNIYKLSLKSSVFLDHFCSGNSTVAGIFGLFYGIHPTYWTAVKANSVYIDNPVLIDALKDNGYVFGIYAKSNFTRHKIKDTVFRGIDVQESFAGEAVIQQDSDMTAQLISFIGERSGQRRPFMAMAFYKSDHFPYNYPADDSIFLPATDLNFMFTTADTDPADYLNDNRNAKHYVDKLVGKIIDSLDSLGDMENTIIIVTTDHSDELNDNRANYWGHGTNYTQYQVRVPLVLYLPDRQPASIEYPTSHIDIVPTLLYDYFGCVNDIGDYSNGRDLFDKPEGIRPIVVGGYVNHAFIIEDNVYEIYPLYTKKYKLSDINLKASDPAPGTLKIIKEEVNRFYVNMVASSG
jgi:membrane-anchored protein YejM (alkaline phosphatase superfamily)